MPQPTALAGLARLGALFLIPILPLAAAGSCWLRDGASPAPGAVYLLCEQGTLWATSDAGQNWTSSETKAPERLRGLVFLDAKRGLAIGDRGTLLATADSGKTWEARDAGTKEHLMDVSFVGESGWIVGFQGLILHSTDGGKTWTKQTSGTTQTLEGVSFLDATHGWTVGWAGTILRTSDGGTTWESVKSKAASWSLSAVYFKDASNGFVVGFAGQVLKSKDGGATWEAKSSPVRGWLTSVGIDANNRVWVTHDDGFLLSEDSGDTWKTVNANGRYFLARLLRVNNSLWAIGQSTVLRQGDAQTWQRIESLKLGSTGASAGQPAETGAVSGNRAASAR